MELNSKAPIFVPSGFEDDSEDKEAKKLSKAAQPFFPGRSTPQRKQSSNDTYAPSSANHGAPASDYNQRAGAPRYYDQPRMEQNSAAFATRDERYRRQPPADAYHRIPNNGGRPIQHTGNRSHREIYSKRYGDHGLAPSSTSRDPRALSSNAGREPWAYASYRRDYPSSSHRERVADQSGYVPKNMYKRNLPHESRDYHEMSQYRDPREHHRKPRDPYARGRGRYADMRYSSAGRDPYSRDARNSVQTLFAQIEREKYGDIVTSSLERNPWDSVGRLKATENAHFQTIEDRSGGDIKSKLRTKFATDGALHVYPSEANGPDHKVPRFNRHAARERRKAELLASKLADYGIPPSSFLPHQQQRVENVDFEIANTLRRRKYEKQLKQKDLAGGVSADRSPRLSAVIGETKFAEPSDRYGTPTGIGSVRIASSALPTMKHGENKNWKAQLGVTEDIGANRWIRLRKHQDGIYTKGDPTKRKTHADTDMSMEESPGLAKAKMDDSKYAPSIRVKSKRKVEFEHLAPGVVVVRNAIDPDTQIWLAKIAKKEGAKPDHGFWATREDGTKTLNSTAYRGRIYDKLETYENGEELRHYAQSICAKVREKHQDLPMVFPTHLLLLHYETDKGIGWHADDAENDGRNNHPIISFCLGNTCKFGIRPLWKHFTTEEVKTMSTEEYKKQSYATDPEFLDLRSGDVILWGGINRMLVHNVEEVTPNTAPPFLRQLVKNVRYNFTFRDCSNIAGREEEFKYYIPSQGRNEETRNFRTFEL